MKKKLNRNVCVELVTARRLHALLNDVHNHFWMPLSAARNMKNKNGKRININRTVCRTRLALAVSPLRLVNILTSSKSCAMALVHSRVLSNDFDIFLIWRIR